MSGALSLSLLVCLLASACLLAPAAGAAPRALEVTRAAPLVGGVPAQDALGVEIRIAGRLRHRASPAVPLHLQGTFAVPRGRAIGIALAAARGDVLRALPRARRVARAGAAAWEVWLPLRGHDLRVTVDATTGALVERLVLGLRADGIGLVFDPDPLALAPDARDAANASTPELAAARVERTLPGLDGSGRLRGPYVRVSGPVPAAEPSLRFDYGRDDPRFEQVMAYYHASEVGSRFRALGLDTGPVVQVEADGIPDDNSYYSQATGSIVFGTGGVDDAEDGGVIAHEYAHALQAVYAPGFPVSEEGMAVAEGFADYVAAGRAERAGIDPVHARCIFAWDVRSLGLDCARRIERDLRYPEDLAGEPHADGLIWASTLLDLRERAGADVADRLALASSAYLQPRSGLADAAAGLAAAERDVLGGSHAQVVADVLTAHGLVPGAVPVAAPRTTVRVGTLRLRGATLLVPLHVNVRARVRVELERLATGTGRRVWERTLGPGKHQLSLRVRNARTGRRYVVELLAGATASELSPIALRVLAARPR